MTDIDDHLPHQHTRLAAECLRRLARTADPAERAALEDEAHRWLQRAEAVTQWRGDAARGGDRASAA